MRNDRGLEDGKLGAGAPLVFIHGSGDSARRWDRLIQHLGEPARRAVALDLPGHGGRVGEPLPDPATVAEYAAVVRRDIEGRGLAGVILVGHSLGSAIALRLALDAAELVERVALIGAGARLRVLPALLELARAQPEVAWRQVVELGHAPGYEALAEADASGASPAVPGALYRDLTACDTFDVMAELGGVRQPALVIVGAEDQMTPPKYAAYLVEHLPRATLVTIPNVGHYVMDEAPVAAAASLREWLHNASA